MRQDTKCYNVKEKKKTYVTYKVWYRLFSKISNIGIAIIDKWIAFHDRDALNSNPALSKTIIPITRIADYVKAKHVKNHKIDAKAALEACMDSIVQFSAGLL